MIYTAEGPIGDRHRASLRDTPATVCVGHATRKKNGRIVDAGLQPPSYLIRTPWVLNGFCPARAVATATRQEGREKAGIGAVSGEGLAPGQIGLPAETGPS